MITRRLNMAVAISVVTLFLVGCKEHKKGASEGPVQLPVAEVQAMNIPVSMDFVGQTYGRNDIQIVARVDGFLDQMCFREGSFVKKGTLLYVIEPAPYTAQMLQARAKVSSTEAQLLQAKQNYDRTKVLFESDVASQSDWDNAVMQFNAAQASVDAARAALTSSRIEQGYTQVLAPVDGIIGRTQALPGDYVGPSTPFSNLNTVSQVDSMKVLFYIPDRDYVQMLQRHKASFADITMTLSDMSVYPYKGRFSFIGRAVEQSTGSLDAQVMFPNPDTLLRPGQYAKITAVVDTLYNAAVIPQIAVSQMQGVYSVYLLSTDNKVEQKIVTAGRTVGNLWEITSGLKPGDRVVTEGFHKIRPGMTIEPVTTPK